MTILYTYHALDSPGCEFKVEHILKYMKSYGANSNASPPFLSHTKGSRKKGYFFFNGTAPKNMATMLEEGEGKALVNG